MGWWRPRDYFMRPTKNVSILYLVSGVDSGSCLEELPHHTEVAFGGCNCQCSVSIL